MSSKKLPTVPQAFNPLSENELQRMQVLTNLRNVENLTRQGKHDQARQLKSRTAILQYQLGLSKK